MSPAVLEPQGAVELARLRLAWSKRLRLHQIVISRQDPRDVTFRFSDGSELPARLILPTPNTGAIHDNSQKRLRQAG